MSSMTPPLDSTIDHDEYLAAMLAELAEQQRHGLTPDVQSVAQSRPELVDELRKLWATAQFAAAFARPSITLEEAPATPAMMLPTEFGDYELLEEIGRGGMGVVYKARQKSLQRTVALKMMRDARLASDADRARFRAEASAAARLKHPNIVMVHEVGEHEGQPYFVMEYVEGESLSHRVSEQGPLPSREAARVVAQVARAVQHAHQNGLLHRDLKPANILLEKVKLDAGLALPKPKVTDFGLAKRFQFASGSIPEWATQTGAVIGTPSYMSPEQATGRKDLTPASDVYSLGAILYELLTGRPPFQAASPVDTLLMVIEQEPMAPSDWTRGVDRDMEMICLKCLQKPTELRYSSAAELADDLEAYLAGESISHQASSLRYFLARLLRETHHVGVLENWGSLWMWHSLMIFLLCLATQLMAWAGVRSQWFYLALWTTGLVTWGARLWQLRRKAGPVLFVERQIAHAWAAGVCASIFMFVIEVLSRLPVLTLSPAIAVAAGMVFVFTAGILSGRFYVTAGAMFLTACVMPLLPDVNVLLFGIASGLSFFIPGLKYYRVRQRKLRDEANPCRTAF